MKHKFVLSIITTLVTLIVFVTSIFAWMTVNNSVGAGGASGSTIEISTIDVKMYNTTYDASNNLIIDTHKTPQGQLELVMPTYDNEANDETKILVEVTIAYKNTLNHSLYLNTNYGSIVFSNYTTTDTITSHLSNTIAVYDATYINGIITLDNNSKRTFFNDNYSKNYNIVLLQDRQGIENTQDTLYFVIDYDTSLFDNIYTSLLSSEFSNNATINTKVVFTSDVRFRLEAQ